MYERQNSGGDKMKKADLFMLYRKALSNYVASFINNGHEAEKMAVTAITRNNQTFFYL
jgi:hypothetical protein